MLQTLLSFAWDSYRKNKNYNQPLKYNVCLQRTTNDLIIFINIYY